MLTSVAGCGGQEDVSRPVPASLTLSFHASQPVTPMPANADPNRGPSSCSSSLSITSTPSPLTISARDHKSGCSSFSKLATADISSSSLLSECPQNQSNCVQSNGDGEGDGDGDVSISVQETVTKHPARVRVPVSKLKEVSPPHGSLSASPATQNTSTTIPMSPSGMQSTKLIC